MSTSEEVVTIKASCRLNDKVVTITGGAGFIGKHLVERLMDKNDVVVYDDFSRGDFKEDKFLKNDRVRIVRGDVLDLSHLRQSIVGSDVVFHLAAICGVDTVVRNPVKTMEVNFLGTRNVLEVAKELNINHVITVSTSEVYGQLALKVGEETPTVQGPVNEIRWGYAVSKLATEHLAQAYYKQYGVNVTIVRPFNVYGPGQVGVGAIRNFVTNALRDETIGIYGDGNQIRAWCYIDDLIDGLLLIPFNLNTIGETFNIGNPRETVTIYRLAKLVKELTKTKSQIRYVHREQPVMDVYVRVPDITRAKKVLGYDPKISLEEGLEKTIEWYRREG